MSSNCSLRINFVLHLIKLLTLGAMASGSVPLLLAQAEPQATPKKETGAPPATLDDENLEKALKLLREKMAEVEKTHAVATVAEPLPKADSKTTNARAAPPIALAKNSSDDQSS